MRLEAATLQSVTGKDVVTEKEYLLHFPSENSHSVLIFLSAKCPCSNSHTQILKNLSSEYKEFQFYAIHSNADEDAALTKSYFAKAAFPFPTLQDTKSELANKLGALKTPHAFVLNQKGEVIYQGGVTDSHIGPEAKKNFLKEVLEDLREGKNPRHKEGRALGCYIQREEE